MTSPLIGITTTRQLSNDNLPMIAMTEAYVQAVLRAGGIPVLLPIGLNHDDLSLLRKSLSGILFSGGGDIMPEIFDGKPNPRINEVIPERDELEIALVCLAAETRWPFLGICRGIQVINVALGGSLYTDIGAQLPGALRHDYYPNLSRDLIAHKVNIKPDSRLATIVSGSELGVNSLHHQGIEHVADGLEVLATSADGLVEAVWLKGHPFGLGVQWHPEWLPGSTSNQAIFRAFIEGIE
jgi:putative glutamine amidotransferase